MKKMKNRIWSALLSVLLVFQMLSVPVFAEGQEAMAPQQTAEISVSLDKSVYEADETATASITVKNAEFDTFGITLGFDEEAMGYEGVTLADGFTPVKNGVQEDGTLLISGSGLNGTVKADEAGVLVASVYFAVHKAGTPELTVVTSEASVMAGKSNALLNDGEYLLSTANVKEGEEEKEAQPSMTVRVNGVERAVSILDTTTTSGGVTWTNAEVTYEYDEMSTGTNQIFVKCGADGDSIQVGSSYSSSSGLGSRFVADSDGWYRGSKIIKNVNPPKETVNLYVIYTAADGTVSNYRLSVIKNAQTGVSLEVDSSMGYSESSPGAYATYTDGYFNGMSGNQAYAFDNLIIYKDGTKVKGTAVSPSWSSDTSAFAYKVDNSGFYYVYIARPGRYWIEGTTEYEGAAYTGYVPVHATLNLTTAKTIDTNVKVWYDDASYAEMPAEMRTMFETAEKNLEAAINSGTMGSQRYLDENGEITTTNTGVPLYDRFGKIVTGAMLSEEDACIVLDLSVIMGTWKTNQALGAAQFEAYQKICAIDLDSITDPDEYREKLIDVIDAKWALIHTASEEEVAAVLAAVVTPAEPVTVNVTIRSQAAGAYFHGFGSAVSVSSDLAESYGYTDQITNGVSALDALVKAQELTFGEEFTAETAKTYLDLSSSGFVSTLFGIETTANGFALNEGYPNDGTLTDWVYNGTTVINTPVVEGDVLDFFIYGDTSSWSDAMSWTELDSTQATAGSTVTATVKSCMYMKGSSYQTPEAFKAAATAAEGAGLAWVDITTGAVTEIENAATGTDGTASVTVPAAPGTYYLTAVSRSAADTYVFMNPTMLTVTEAPLMAGVISSAGNIEFDQNREATMYWDAGDTQFRFKPWIPAGTTAKDTDLKLTYQYINTDGEEKSVESTANGIYIWFREDFLSVSGQGNDMTILAEKDGVSQTYVLHVKRQAYITGLTATDQKGFAVTLSPTFSKTKTEYTAAVLDNVTSVTLKATDPVEAVNPDSSGVLFNGTKSEDGSYIWELAPGENTMVIQADNGADSAQEYTVKITQTASVTLTPKVTPAEAYFALYRGAKNEERIWPEADGTFKLFPETEYHYTVACSGYVGQSGSITLTEYETKEFTLEKAPETEPLPQLEADYPSFRAGRDNMSVISAKTPVEKSTIEVKWERQMGDYVSPTSGTTPIIVDDKVYTFSANTIYMLDKETGEILKSAQAVANAGFALTPPTYADGMLFVLLSNGIIQCFNAQTLESLWVYTDPQGGQCNSAIRYDDGYIYVGFFSGSAAFVCLSTTDEDPSSGTEAKVPIWRNSSLGAFYWDGAWTNEKYVFVVAQKNLCCLDKKTGEAVQVVPVDPCRCDVAYYNGRIYFTSQSGLLYSYNLTADGKLDLENLIEPLYFGGQSSSTPAIYNNRIYIGTSNGGNFGVEGYGILVGDINPETGAMSVAYVVPTDGYPQTSGLISTGYEEENGYVYVYFLSNSAHGTLYMVKDKAGLTSADPATGAFYTPNHEQYCIASAVADSDGNLYLKNDSAWQFVLTRSELYLKDIVITGGNAVLDGGEEFNGSLSDHVITVDPGTSSVKLDLTPSDGTEIVINGVPGQSQDVALTDGNAKVQVLLKKGDSSKVYNFGIVSGPTLKSMTVTNSPNSGGVEYTMTPEFDVTVTDYVAGIEKRKYGYIWYELMNPTDVLTATAVSGVKNKEEGDELIVIDNAYGKRVEVYYADTKNPTSATVKLTLTSADGTQSKTYNVTLYTQNAIPLLTLPADAVTERTETTAKLTASASKAGELYYLVQGSDEAAPDAAKILADGQKAEVAEGENTLDLTGLSRNAGKIYLVLKAETGTNPLVYAADIPSAGILGDLNNDGKVTNADVSALLDKVTAGETVELAVGDLNGDGKITNADVSRLLDLVTAGQI